MRYPYVSYFTHCEYSLCRVLKEQGFFSPEKQAFGSFHVYHDVLLTEIKTDFRWENQRIYLFVFSAVRLDYHSLVKENFKPEQPKSW